MTPVAMAVRPRLTKILATLGPSTDAPGVLGYLIDAGMDCARVSCSHGGAEDHLRRIRAVRDAARRAGRDVGVLLDLQGPKLRLADETPVRTLACGDEVVFTSPQAARTGDVVVEVAELGEIVEERSEIVVGDGSPRFAVTRVAEGRVFARTVASGAIGPRKGVWISRTRPSLPAITDQDLADVELAVDERVDYVALSFVRTAAEVRELRTQLRSRNSSARVIAKIEKVEALDHLDEILAAADGIMVARGDYGVEAGLEHVPAMQKDVIRRATEAGVLVITATQMLESMITASEPTRAEASDVANAIIDGSSALMLSAETAIGVDPVRPVRWMAQIARAIERRLEIRGATGPAPADGPDAAVLRSAVALAEATGACALMVSTRSGASARACAKYRPQVPVIALVQDGAVARQLSLEWGVFAATIDGAESFDGLIEAGLARANLLEPPGDEAVVVITTGSAPGRSGGTDSIILRRVSGLDRGVAPYVAESIRASPSPL